MKSRSPEKTLPIYTFIPDKLEIDIELENHPFALTSISNSHPVVHVQVLNLKLAQSI